MSLGHLLLAPQRVPRATTTDSDAALIMDVLAAVARISADKAKGGTMVDDFEAAFEALGQRLLENAGGGLVRAVERMNDLTRPLATLADEIPDLLDGDPAAIADKLLELFGRLAEFAEHLTLENIREHAEVLVDIVQTEFGLDSTTLESQFWQLLDDIVGRLETIPDDLDEVLRWNRRATAGAMRRIARRARGAIHLPELNADRLATLIFDALAPFIGDELKKAACAGKASSDVLAAIRAVKDLVPYTGFGSRSIGAAEDPPNPPEREYMWYGSWVLGDKDVAWYEVWRGKGDVWIDRTGTINQSRHRTNRIYLSDAFTWTDIPIGGKTFTVTYKHLSPEVMEKIAWHSAWGAEFDEALLHLWSPLGGTMITKGGQVSLTDLFDSVIGGGHTTLKVAKKMPFPFWVSSKGEWWVTPVGWSPTLASHIGGSFQGFHFNASGWNAFKMWGVLVAFDAMRALSANSLPSMIREALLSLLTLYNYDGPVEAPLGDDNRPINKGETAGLVAIPEFLITMGMFKLVFDRKYYGLPFKDTSNVDEFLVTVWCKYWLLAGTVTGIFNGFLGTAFAQSVQAIMGSPATDWPLLGKNILKCTVKSLLMFWINAYIWREGDTDGGTYNPAGSPKFDGYPDPETSPYLLPWTGGDTIVCSQGNQGLFSHNLVASAAGEQVYAYDFHLDQGDQIRAARAGTVVDYFDSVPTNEDVNTPADIATTGTANNDKNFIVIRHDAANAAHDKGPGGAAVPTYAIYLHGLHHGVRDVFAARGVNANAIIGTAVAQGDPIMFADSTGNSLCNHVHMEVVSGPAAGAVTIGGLGVTIPFVFKDGGQPSSRQWLESENAS